MQMLSGHTQSKYIELGEIRVFTKKNYSHKKLKSKKKLMTENNNIVIYQSEDGKVHLDVVYNEGTMWLTQQQMPDLYQTSRTNIVEHIKHIYEDGELTEEATCRKFRTGSIGG